MYKTVQCQLKGVKKQPMYKYQVLVVAMVLSATFLVAPAVQGKTGTSAHQSHGARGRVNFIGEVLKVDTASQSMTLRSGGSTVGFNISNPVLQGYRSIADIRKGDRVGAGYTTDGILITKLPKSAERVTVEKSVPPSSVRKPKKPSPFARRTKTDGKSFADVDNNKDGKISPVELSVVIPNLTMEQFRQYDKNRDGHLDKAEFGQINAQ
jgi:hypothetical protein